MNENVVQRVAVGSIATTAVIGLALVALPVRSQAPARATSPPVSLANEIPTLEPFRAKGIFNVRDFGATGNGETDDTDALQHTIDAAERVHGVAALDPPSTGFAGHYFVSRTLEVKQPVAIVGLTRATTILVKRLDMDVFAVTGRGIEFGLFTIAGDRAAGGSGGVGFHIMHSQNILIQDVSLAGLWSGTLNEGSGNVGWRNVGFIAADRPPDPAHPRFGLKATASVPGNSNLTFAEGCTVLNPGVNRRTVDGYVLANGYNSLAVVNSGVLGGNRAVWTTADGGRPPNFLVMESATSDHSNVGIELDAGAVAQISSSLVTSAPVASIRIGPEYRGGPVSIANTQVISDAEGIDVEGGANVTISGGQISNIGRGDGIRVGSNGAVTLSGIGIDRIHQGSGLHVVDSHGSGWITATGLNVRSAGGYGVEVDGGTQGGYTISGSSFGENRQGNVRDGGTNPRRVLQLNSTY